MCTNNSKHWVIPTGTYVTNRPFLTLPFTIRHTAIPGLAYIFLVMTFWHYTTPFHQPSLPASCGIKGSCSTWLPRICLRKPNNPWIQHRILIQPSMKSQSLKITVFLLVFFLFIADMCITFCRASSVFSGFVLSAWEASFIGIGMNLNV